MLPAGSDGTISGMHGKQSAARSGQGIGSTGLVDAISRSESHSEQIVVRPRVSVCMATYKGAEWVRVQVESILAQLEEDDELLVQDDRSPDDTVAILKSYGDPRIKLEINPTNLGVIPNFEQALRRASGEIVFLADQDDEWLPGKVDAMLAVFGNPRVMGVVTNATIVDGEGKIIHESYFEQAKSGPGVLRNIVKNSYLGCCLAVRHEVLAVALPVPLKVRTHDGWIGLCANMLGQVRFLDTPYLNYRRHGANVSQMHRFGILDIMKRRVILLAHVLRVMPGIMSRRRARKRLRPAGE